MSSAILSPRQRDVLREILSGHDTKIAARNLGLCPSTIKNHTHAIYARLNVGSREQVLAKLMRPTEEALELIGQESLAGPKDGRVITHRING